MSTLKAFSLAFQLNVFFTTALTASLPAHISPPTSMSSLSAQLNSTLPLNLTLLNSPSNHLPNDPFITKIPPTNLLLGFHNYGPRLPEQPTFRTLQTAVEDVIHHIWRDPSKGDIPMVPKLPGYVYGTDAVRLLVRPENGITWGMWGNVIRTLRLFGETYEFVRLDFEVWDEEVGEDVVGVGRLWGV